LRFAPDALEEAGNEGFDGSVSFNTIRYRNQTPTVPNECWLAGFSWPDNEHHAALGRSP
jgi:hypothetical protein